MFSKKDNSFICFLFFIVFSIFLLFFDFYYCISDKIRFYTNRVVFIYYYIFDNLIFLLKKNIVFLNDYNRIYNENVFLKEKNFILKKRIMYSSLLKLENNYLRKILNFPLLSKESKDFVFVKIFFYHFNDTDEIIINHLKNSNIKYGSLLFNYIGMLGKVIYSGDNFSRLQLICNQNSSFPVSILRNDLSTIVSGNGCNNNMKISDLPIGSDVKVGDIVILPKVSGYSFSGHPIGVVDNVYSDFLYGVLVIEVKYFLDLNNLGYGLLYN